MTYLHYTYIFVWIVVIPFVPNNSHFYVNTKSAASLPGKLQWTLGNFLCFYAASIVSLFQREYRIYGVWYDWLLRLSARIKIMKCWIRHSDTSVFANFLDRCVLYFSWNIYIIIHDMTYIHCIYVCFSTGCLHVQNYVSFSITRAVILNSVFLLKNIS